MAHYAFLDENNIVTEVIPGKDETELIEGLTPEEWYGNYRGQTCVRTSYNTQGNQHPEGRPSWQLDQETYLWQAPEPMPTDDKLYTWDESTLTWTEVTL